MGQICAVQVTKLWQMVDVSVQILMSKEVCKHCLICVQLVQQDILELRVDVVPPMKSLWKKCIVVQRVQRSILQSQDVVHRINSRHTLVNCWCVVMRVSKLKVRNIT